MSQSKSIVGTWRLRTYEVWTAQGQVSFPLGESPVGFAVFDETGHAFIQLARAIDPHSGSLNLEAVRETLASSFSAYFGTYTVNTNGTRLSIQVQGSNRAAYVGSILSLIHI